MVISYKDKARCLTLVAAGSTGQGFAVPAVVAGQGLLLGASTLLPLWTVCYRDCGNCFSCQPILKSSQDRTSAPPLLAARHRAPRCVLQPWKYKAGSRNGNLGSVAGQETPKFMESSQWRMYMNAEEILLCSLPCLLLLLRCPRAIGFSI